VAEEVLGNNLRNIEVNMKEIDIEKLKSSTVITIFQQSVQVLMSAAIVTLIIFKLLEFEGVFRIIFLYTHTTNIGKSNKYHYQIRH